MYFTYTKPLAPICGRFTKSVNLSKFKALEFRVFRKSDGEFRFICPIKRQITNPANAIILEHSSKIKRLPKRQDTRFPIQFKRKFYFITSGTVPKRPGEAPSEISSVGTVEDMSIGGMKFSLDDYPDAAVAGTTVVFGLEEAGIKQEINGNIVRISETDDGTRFVHLQFYDLSELNRLYIQRFIAGFQTQAKRDRVVSST